MLALLRRADGGARASLALPALQAAGGACRRASSAALEAEDASNEQDLYSVLGVKPSATRDELKRAFRAKARLLHPDASQGCSDHAAFVRLVHAYQVLANSRSRQLYDLSRERGNPSVLRAAAANGVPGAASAAYDEVEVDLSWGLGRMFTPQGSSPAGSLDKVRQELTGELHSAVRRAYLGPRLEELASGALPDAFEADERATPDCPDLLQLVSGRQLLGAVRERRLELLARQSASAAALREGQQAAAAGALPPAAGEAAAREEEQPQHCNQAEGQARQQQEAEAPTSQSAQQEAQPARQDAQQHAQQQQAQGQQQKQGQRDPDILDLFVGDELVASAVRHFPRQQQQQQQQQAQVSKAASADTAAGNFTAGPSSCDSSSGGDSSGNSGTQSVLPEPGESGTSSMGDGLPAEVVGIYDRAGQLLAQVEAMQLDPGSATASSARLLNAQGLPTHTVYRTQTPLVRHLTFAAIPDALRLKSSRPSQLVVCRARRAWLPPSSLWVFKPLSYEHDIGGWCLEWAGDAHKGHPAWLDPAVFVLTAAFDTLDSERAARQPLGLFSRLRAARAAAAAGSGEEGATEAQEQGWRGWWKSALRFHGCS
ncbi:chaperone -domain-containing [Chlorella sorokiniana]|uniref:Chaperone-domain-containing n=1 Tax=Chlorella sorokiniana TaxID=3076 RepID=A0A2P6TC57_CHLSO|nr:chaperone -domain-containing [Chlorella sorokiniana]|eukprot:PRW20219.1 chaperone -domain-containing [Chlorella sorokiniana]